MDEITTILLNIYDTAMSHWLTLGEQRQLALLMMLSGALGALPVLLRLMRKEPKATAQTTSEVAKPASVDESLENISKQAEATVSTPAAKPVDASWLGGLQKTRQALSSKLQQIFSSDTKTEELFSQLEELLITSDMGVKTTKLLLANVKEQTDLLTPEVIRSSLYDQILEIMTTDSVPEIVPEKINGEPLVIVVIGVNGVGKTTTIGKLAWQFGAQGKKVMIAAGDTFRAAAEQQLQIWADRSGATVSSGAPNAKPSTVVYEAVHQAKREGFDVLIVDTAGRLHTRVNLMNELQNVLHILNRELPGSPHETILVLDATTGQNALQQAIDFNACAPLSGIIITKLDGTPKGGIVVAISHELGIPIRYVGIGEQATDLKLFSAEEFTDALFADEEMSSEEVSQGHSKVREVEQSSPETSNEAGSNRRVVRRREHT